ncbi:hypothetical protein PHPALM_29364 [Phytophthora palmivora]|uniref:Uncharacterized protein n=1 Tax=Phytophthora palmivora TaxID=4796 RepID=A0A2P4X7R9_9STRA|nr:hypothetical protein PHPALM_29364 [Phytophthora palmivora]
MLSDSLDSRGYLGIEYNQLPVCTTKNCKCTPKVKEDLHRTVHDVQHKTKLYYTRSVFRYRLFDLVYDSMLTTKELAGATDNITRRRQKRYYNLLVFAASEIENVKLQTLLTVHLSFSR